MPLTAKGEEIMTALKKEYGSEKGEQVFYAGKNKGTFSGVDNALRLDACARLAGELGAKADAEDEQIFRLYYVLDNDEGSLIERNVTVRAKNLEQALQRAKRNIHVPTGYRLVFDKHEIVARNDMDSRAESEHKE